MNRKLKIALVIAVVTVVTLAIGLFTLPLLTPPVDVSSAWRGKMFGVPLSVYIVTWAVGVTLPEGILWGNTLTLYVGHWVEYVGVVMILIGALFIIFGWKEIYKQYWSKEKGTGKLVTDGIYAFVRHPQYTGLILITLGLIAIWATIPLLIMWPILGLLYYRLAKKEEKEMEKEFGNEYIEYKRTTSMFIPKLV